MTERPEYVPREFEVPQIIDELCFSIRNIIEKLHSKDETLCLSEKEAFENRLIILEGAVDDDAMLTVSARSFADELNKYWSEGCPQRSSDELISLGEFVVAALGKAKIDADK